MELENLLNYVWNTPARVAAGALQVHEFTALFSVKESKALLATLKAQQEKHPPFEKVSGIHHLRWFTFEPNQDTGKRVLSNPTALILAIVYDGELDDMLARLSYHAGDAIRDVLRHTRDDGRYESPTAHLLERRIESGYLFRDLGLLGGPDVDPAYLGDATVTEINEALSVQKAFEEFYARHPPTMPAAALRRAFMAEFGKYATSLPVTKFERRFPGEARYIRRVVELNERLQERTQMERSYPKPLRGAHAKGHALLRARFAVEQGLDPKLRKGVFAIPGQEFDAWLRPSNGLHARNPDRNGDSRGLAISLDVNDEGRPWVASRDGRIGASHRQQDFVTFSHPVFFSRNVREFTTLMSILTSNDKKLTALRAFAFSIAEGNLTWIVQLLRILAKKVGHPFGTDFHSATPYALGDDTVVKYSVEPADKRALDRFVADPTDDDYLHKVLRRSLEDGPIKLNFYLHVFHSRVPTDATRDAIEDTTCDWTKRNFTFKYGIGRFGRALADKVHAATITIPGIAPNATGLDDPTSAESRAAADDRSFNPWHHLDAHRPLGSLNRARWFIYPDSSHSRHTNWFAKIHPNDGATADPPLSGPNATNDANTLANEEPRIVPPNAAE